VIGFSIAQVAFTLAYIDGMIAVPLLTAVEGDSMSKLIPGNQKHLTLADRIHIEKSLNEGQSFKDIARFICKDPTTVSKEIRSRRISDWYHKGTFYNAHNFCIHRYRCRKTNVCGKIILCGINCTSCPTCNQTCKDFVKERCTRLVRAPYVCNGCDKKINHCTIAQKYFYNARFAERKYKEILSDSRAGINMTKHELRQIDAIVTPLVAQGQSPYQILTNHPELAISVRTLYQYIDDGLLLTRNIDLKRKAKFKPRKVHKTQIKDRTVFEGRTYTDFQALCLDTWTEMDTVHSSRESKKTLLTFFFKREKLFLAFLMNRCTKGAVRLIFDRLEKKLGTYEFLALFNTVLTDRGSEFGAPEALETGIHSIERSSIYFCDPMRSGQKGGVENVHTMLRMILPKGTSFEFLTQWDVNLIVNHINSTPRESLGGKTPYEMALESFGESTLKALQLRPIAPDEVNLTPKLIRYNR
jgi:IS30 family transposase